MLVGLIANEPFVSHFSFIVFLKQICRIPTFIFWTEASRA